MKTILEELYGFDYFHLRVKGTETAEEREALKNLIEAEKAIKEAYPDCTELLEKYQAAENIVADLESRREFVKGFRAGAQIFLEMMQPVR